MSGISYEDANVWFGTWTSYDKLFNAYMTNTKFSMFLALVYQRRHAVA